MEKTKIFVPWSPILFVILVALKFTVATSMPIWIMFAPLWLPLAFIVVLLFILGFVALIAAALGK